MITFACPSCGRNLTVKDELAGTTGKCPQCKQFAQVPGNANHVEKSVVSSEAHYFLAPAQGPDELGRLGSYRVLKVLGSGGMGVVFLAEDPGLKRKVALKAMLPSLAASDSCRKRFVREAQTAAALEHDNIVHIYQVGEDRGVPFIAMQFLKGEALDQRLARGGRLPLAEVVRIGRETALGLAAAHGHGLVHRDIKPANLWLEEGTDRVKILDFGLARAAADDANLTQSGAIIGTPAYMAPEQAHGQPVEARSDLFSLGCVLYRLCIDELPFRGSDAISTLMSVATHEPAPPHEIDESVPQELSELIMKLMAKAPADRPASAAQVAQELGRLASMPEFNEDVRKKRAPATSKNDFPSRSVTLQENTKAKPLAKKASPGGRNPSHQAARGNKTFWLAAAGAGGLAALGVVAVIALLVVRSLTAGNKHSGDSAALSSSSSDSSSSQESKPSSSSAAPVGSGDDLEALVLGHWKLKFTGASEGQKNWEFREDHKAFENATEVATWRVEFSKIIVTYYKVDFNKAELEFQDEDTMVGKNVYTNGRTFNWTLTRTTGSGSGSGIAPFRHERDVTSWALQKGAQVLIDAGKGNIEVKTVAELPKKRFNLVKVGFADGSNLRDEDLSRFVGLAQFRDLQIPGAAAVTDAGVLQLKDLPVLGALNVSRTQITDTSLQHLRNFTKLDNLDVAGTKITSDGLAHLKALKILGFVNVGAAGVTDEGIENLKEMKSLRHVRLGGSQVTAKGAEALQKALPDARIER